jgi:hypothetical protein
MIRMGCLSEKFIDLMIKSTSKSTFTLLKLELTKLNLSSIKILRKKRKYLVFSTHAFYIFLSILSLKNTRFYKNKSFNPQNPQKRKEEKYVFLHPNYKSATKSILTRIGAPIMCSHRLLYQISQRIDLRV